MASISIRIDDETKDKLDVFCDSVGLTVSSIFNMFAKRVVRENRIPFDICGDPFYSDENQQRLKQSLLEAKSGKLTPHELFEVDD